ncbi:nickel pincer cofactor biosynthesis protein LarC [Kribbella jiaozuonensis]|uniref:Pyridinium-3,5-bisthiocarboxylic acid mononucleotide nickel insertion protein n=1 Tax=Kribbella jiaozuonensis TaxID=2575441 RepID=A0A4U3LPG9_9ACTN|nr:nickel pincer cofactor biosynthesis protein LarC [Kribbella jiaozuonensis]TKK77552.1 nickel pincer cofactor biosynthesis protein LarC [Kribbella jiaozuonensis]
MRIAWLDCSAGASGDMLLGAFIAAGADVTAINTAVAAVDPSLSVTVSQTARHQIAATKATVEVNGEPHPENTPDAGHGHAAGHGHTHAADEGEHADAAGHGHGHGHDDAGHGADHEHSGPTRAWADVRRLLEEATLNDAVRRRALDTFARLARAEAAAHGVEPDTVHFHEVGALDAIADIVGVAAASVSLDIDRIVVSTVVLGGGGQVRGQHGGIPIPGPAVLAILSEAQAPVTGGAAPYEMTTPTGAALLASLADEYGTLPPMRIQQTGVGAGGRDPVEVPNILRVVLGESTESSATELVYETNVDDLDPRIWPQVLARLMEAGAADAWLTPILMKKGRPAHTLSVLVGSANAEMVRAVILSETSAIGLREFGIRKHAADREFATVDVEGQRIHVKIARYGGQVVNVQPEYDDVAAAASVLKKPVKSILAKAVAAGHDLWG